MTPRLAKIPVPAPSGESNCDSLVVALAALHDHLRRLTEIASEKLAAMRTADVSRLNALVQDEARELLALSHTDGARSAALADLAQSLPGCDPLTLRLSELAARLPEPHSSKILAKSEGLRAAAKNLERRNQSVANVARTLHGHIRGVFAELASANQETHVYGRTGQHEQRTTHNWVEAVG